MSLRHAVLGVLSGGSASGYDLGKVFDLSLAHVWPAARSQIYAELIRLAGTGQVTVSARGPRGRKEYAISESGTAELRRWLTEVEPGRVGRSDVLLRVFFFGVLDREEALAHLGRQVEAAAEEHRHLLEVARVVAEDPDGSLSRRGSLPLEWGLRFTAMQREWARWAQTSLREGLAG